MKYIFNRLDLNGLALISRIVNTNYLGENSIEGWNNYMMIITPSNLDDVSNADNDDLSVIRYLLRSRDRVIYMNLNGEKIIVRDRNDEMIRSKRLTRIDCKQCCYSSGIGNRLYVVNGVVIQAYLMIDSDDGPYILIYNRYPHVDDTDNNEEALIVIRDYRSSYKQ